MKKPAQIIVTLCLLAVFAFSMATRNKKQQVEPLYGYTMGTSYTVQISDPLPSQKRQQLHRKIEEKLRMVNAQMSTWDPKSEISRFNHQATTNPFTVSPEFAKVIRQSLKLSHSTGGRFDPTLNPLLNIWGFGSESETREPPTQQQIDQTRKQIGWHHLHISDNNQLQKDIPDLQISLGAIAKGYGVDVVSRILLDEGLSNFFVEIGGEVYAHGTKPKNEPWRIGIQYPSLEPNLKLQGILNITDSAIATSGYYPNYIQKNGRVFTHILDPVTGTPRESQTASVTVIAPNCMLADGAATALFVMGADEGLEWTEKQPEVEVLFLIRDDQGNVTETASSGFYTKTAYEALEK